MIVFAHLENELLLSKSLELLLNILRKEVIQPQVPLRLPCYDFTPVTDLTVACCLQKVSTQSSGKTNSHGVTGGVYKARERIHRVMLLRDYWRFRLHGVELQAPVRTETVFWG